MAGMEQLEIHSKSYLVRWVNVRGDNTISWSVRPEKKSLNFGIFKHPGLLPSAGQKASLSTFEPPPSPSLPSEEATGAESKPSRASASTAADKLKGIGLRLVNWYGVCDANEVTTGKYDVPTAEGGMYALVFDNTFSKQQSKRAMFTLLTYPTQSPPQMDHLVHHPQPPIKRSISGVRDSSQTRGLAIRTAGDSTSELVLTDGSDVRRGSAQQADADQDKRYYTGTLQKLRRKKHQGWARRYFALDFETCTLSYYHDRHKKELRGAIPLTLAAVGANGRTRQICIDSGAEVWHLRTNTSKEFDAWKRAMEEARERNAPISPTTTGLARRSTIAQQLQRPVLDEEEVRRWSDLEVLSDQIRQAREAVRSIARDTDPKYLTVDSRTDNLLADERKPRGTEATTSPSTCSESPSEKSQHSYFQAVDGSSEKRPPFWKRKPSTERSMPGIFKRGSNNALVSTQSATPTPRSASSTKLGLGLTGSVAGGLAEQQRGRSAVQDGQLHDRCMHVLQDLEGIVGKFDSILFSNKARLRANEEASAVDAPRASLDSLDEEFFDAEVGSILAGPRLLDLEAGSDNEEEGEDAYDSFSDSDNEIATARPVTHKVTSAVIDKTVPFQLKPNEPLYPFPHAKVDRRTCIPPPRANPPSLIGFLRKNVGKDLSTIAMPVSSNEPLSLLQRLTEMFEASSLLDRAASVALSTGANAAAERLLLVSAFAVASVSANRAKERATRKPFNPMLGETFELVREDLGFRVLGEKVSHRPVRVACTAESERGWSVVQAPLPSQKFWGKSVELTTEGKVRVRLHTTGESFCWTCPTTFLRNILAGEKYVEPVGDLTVLEERSGRSCTVQFKTGGMFSGRSEGVTGTVGVDGGGVMELSGRWTDSLHIGSKGDENSRRCVWTAGALESGDGKLGGGVTGYGFSVFAAQMNQITEMEAGKLPVTDSRLRPDQAYVEKGELDRAEGIKAQLEDAQRQRRKVLDSTAGQWQPRWFKPVEGEEGEWALKEGSEGYWECRRRADWHGCKDVFAL